MTLKFILESKSIAKVFFDVRNDSDALYAHFGIRLQGVWDLQLMESASRQFSKAKLVGLAHCIENDAGLEQETKRLWKDTKQRGLTLFSPERGGSYEVFNTRPLPQDIIDYCTQDVTLLPILYSTYSKKLSKYWSNRVVQETHRRVAVTHLPSFDPHGKNKTFSPWAPQTGKNAQSVGGRRSADDKPETKFMSPGTKVAMRVMNKIAKPTDFNSPAIPANPGPAKLHASDYSEIVNLPNLSISEHNSQLHTQSHLPTPAVPASNPPSVSPSEPAKWTCTVCSKTMENNQQAAHLSGEGHRNQHLRDQYFSTYAQDSSPNDATRPFPGHGTNREVRNEPNGI